MEIGIARDRNGLRHRVNRPGEWYWTIQKEEDGKFRQYYRLRGSTDENPVLVAFGEMDWVTPDDIEYARLKEEVVALRERNDLLERLLGRIITRDTHGWLGRVVRGELRTVIEVHGPVTKQLVPSVLKRIIGQVASEIEHALYRDPDWGKREEE